MGILIRNLFIQTPKFTWKKKLKNYSPFILSRYSEGGLCHAIERARMLSMISAEYRAWPKVETQLLILQCCLSLIPLDSVKFLYSEKVTKFCEISTFLLSYVVPVKSKVEISQNFAAFSEYMKIYYLGNPNVHERYLDN